MNTTKHLTANRCISAVLLLAMLLAMGICFAGCNAAVVPDADPLPTAAPTATPDPTPTPVPTPTPEPTPTPIPEGWIIDPDGNIPTDVEIICLHGCAEDEEVTFFVSFCIAKEDGKYYVQRWSGGSLRKSVLLPEELLEGVKYVRDISSFEGGDFVELGLANGKKRILYINSDGLTFTIDIIDYLISGLGHEPLIYGNVESNIVFVYYLDETYYTLYTFPEGYDVRYEFGLFCDWNSGEYYDISMAEVTQHEIG